MRFGATEDEVVDAVGQQPDHAREGRVSRLHFYDHLGLKVGFDRDGCCHSVELLFPSSSDGVAVIDGDLRLMGEFDDIVQALEQRGYTTRPGPELIPDLNSDAVCDALGIRLWHSTEDVVGIESICAYRHDVYQDLCAA